MVSTSEPDVHRKALLDLTVESWRFTRVFLRMLGKLDAGEKIRFESQLRWYLKQMAQALEPSGLRLVNIENQPFDPGAAATPLNLADFDDSDQLIVDQMLEPIIMSADGIERTGTVILRKGEP